MLPGWRITRDLARRIQPGDIVRYRTAWKLCVVQAVDDPDRAASREWPCPPYFKVAGRWVSYTILIWMGSYTEWERVCSEYPELVRAALAHYRQKSREERSLRSDLSRRSRRINTQRRKIKSRRKSRKKKKP